MKDATPQPIYLADYQPPNWLIDTVELTFKLALTATKVSARIAFRPNPDTTDRAFRLDGENLQLIRAMIDGQPITPIIDAKGLTAAVPDAPFLWECDVEINPEANTELEGLYMSNGLFSTQCEAEGFRKITYYPDRPDVMATFTVRIESDLPVLLSNGNPAASGEGFATWHDPWPKPAYLFALVAGDLVAHSGQHTTPDGRDIALNIWVRPGDEDKCAYALDALKRSMTWDETTYGRVYDLDIFNIVAVDDFNSGAMENKGLNIFNSKYVLASPETATDRDYEFIEGIVAHEYFHNWTGNRITCRDWFQLCLKEGLTVFRDQQFSGDMRSHPVKRIDDVLTLRARQFREDNGPLAHPVRPHEFYEINNFYTATVYEKGAEVIGMLKTLVGDDAYAKALDLYFTRHDGEACTIEDWLKVFEDTTGRDLSQFKRWYSQAGTPRVQIKTEATDGTEWKVTARQSTPATQGQPNKHPLVIPIRIALFNADGTPALHEEVAVLDTEEKIIATGSSDRLPIVSAFRGFSAPVIIEQTQTEAQRLTLLAHDTDPFNRWEAGRQLAKDQLVAMLMNSAAPSPAYLDALNALSSDTTLDPAFRALALQLPSEDDMAQTLFDAGRTPDPSAIYNAIEALRHAIATALHPTFETLYRDMKVPGPYAPDAKSAGKRALRLTALGYLTRAEGTDVAEALFETADNMTESLGALGILLGARKGAPQAETFYQRWHSDAKVLDKWFALQVGRAHFDDAVALATRLSTHETFTWKTPNRFRSLIGALSGNAAAFHHPTGQGYDFISKWLIQMDGLNPQTAARMATAFETLGRYDGDRQGMMRDAANRILNRTDVSADMSEILSRILAQ